MIVTNISLPKLQSQRELEGKGVFFIAYSNTGLHLPENLISKSSLTFRKKKVFIVICETFEACQLQKRFSKEDEVC